MSAMLSPDPGALQETRLPDPLVGAVLDALSKDQTDSWK